MDSGVYNIRLARWQKLIFEANTSGMKKVDWCRMHGITTKQFYYWQKKIRAMTLDEIKRNSQMLRPRLIKAPHFQRRL